MKKLNEILGTKYPFIQGGMANIATGEFAAAVSNAGALGMIATGGWDGDRLRQEIRRAKELTDKPFGVNIMLMHPQADEFAKIVVEEGVQVVTTGAGNPGKYVPTWKAAGIKVIPVVAAALAGELTTEYRTNLRIDVFCEGDEGANGGPDAPMKGSQQFFGLNELTLARGAQGRVIDCTYTVAGEKVADVKGDGLIVATATGSTAYALSAGGPLVAPGYSGLVVVPIAPHSLHSRALVTGPSDIVEIAMDPSSANREATMFIDGELIPIERPIRRVVVQSGEEPTVLLRYKAESFYGRTSRVFFS